MMSGLGVDFYEPPTLRRCSEASIRTARPRVPGLKAGDQIVAVDGVPVHDFNDLQQLIQAASGRR